MKLFRLCPPTTKGLARIYFIIFLFKKKEVSKKISNSKCQGINEDISYYSRLKEELRTQTGKYFKWKVNKVIKCLKMWNRAKTMF